MEELKYLKQELKTQDNFGTDNPLYIVFEKIKYTSREGYTDKYIWVNDDGDNFGELGDFLKHLKEEYVDISENRIRELRNDLEYEDEFKIDRDNYHKWYYQEIPRFVQAFFTKKSAENYIKCNAHNLTNPYIHVSSMYRNEEMKAIRKYFMETELK